MKLYVTFDSDYGDEDGIWLDERCVCVWNEEIINHVVKDNNGVWHTPGLNEDAQSEIDKIIPEKNHNEFLEIIDGKFKAGEKYDLDDFPDIKSYVEKWIRIQSL